MTAARVAFSPTILTRRVVWAKCGSRGNKIDVRLN